jgi:hypothetical protein
VLADTVEAGTGSHRLTIAADVGPFIDPDGFAWEAN